ncbi:MAG: radical SAM protein [Euryarchaeota archaeon]|nr:radical SAM protein [Euryarchaeota archaeon]
MDDYISFGPVPSRRLGRSLGVNNIPGKTCTYGCIYCQIGKTIKMECERRNFYSPDKILKSVMQKLNLIKDKKEVVNYITFVPDGEPTLDINLGKEISLLKETGEKIAIITNSSLIWDEDVRNELFLADLVSLKVDSVELNTWKRINRPHKCLDLNKILDGIKYFSSEYKGKLITETMVVGNIDYDFEKIGIFLSGLNNLHKAYLSIPTRPPAEEWVKKPEENVLNTGYQVFEKFLGEGRVEYLIGYEGEDFSITDNPEINLLSILSVHPMREDAVEKFLERSGNDYSLIEKLLNDGKIKVMEYYGKRYFMRRIL